jgi:type IV pilus assembly protein PilQ
MSRPILPLLALTLLLAAHPAYAETTSQVRDLRVVAGDNDLGRVEIELDQAPRYSARVDLQTRRIIIDVADAVLRGAPDAITKPAGVVGGVLAQTFEDGGRRTSRFIVSLRQEAKYAISTQGNRLVVQFEKGKLGAIEGLPAIPKSAAPSQTAESALSRITDVKFDHESHRDVVEVEVSGRPQFRRDNGSNGRSTLIIRNAALPEALARTLDVTAFGGNVHAVSSYVRGRDVVLEVDRSTKVTSSVELEGNRLVWAFYEPGTLPSSMTGKGKDGLVARRSKTVYVEKGLDDLPQVRTSVGEIAETSQEPDYAGAFAPSVLGQAERFTGRRIDLDLKDADVHNVLRLLGDVGRVNIVVADNVSGNVTIRMRNVPWDQALDVVLQAKKLGVDRRGNLLRVAPLSDLEKEREMELARRKQEVALAPIETRLIPVSYANASDIADRAGVLLTQRGAIAIDGRTNTLVARDVSEALDQVEELIRALDTQTPQVLVEARIVEATSRYLRDVGIQWGGSGTMSAATGNPTGLAFPSAIGLTGGGYDTNAPTQGLSPFASSVAVPNYAVNLPAAVGTGNGGALGLTFGSIDNTVNLAVRLSAAESSGMLRILSSPRILTLDNLEARISQGTLIPFSQVSAQGVQTIFQEAKLQLLVRPHVTAEGSVQMKVKINRDEPDFNQTSARGDPTILKREAETELLVLDGHTAVIGGIFTRNTGRNLDQVPFFGDIPLLGLLFQRRRASDTRGELVIFITPRIVNRAEALGR